MPIYLIKTDAGRMYASVNLVETSSTIYTYFGNDPYHTGEKDDEGIGWRPTPYQNADAHQREGEMAKLVADYCNMGKVISVESI
jgi:hypothetical protein